MKKMTMMIITVVFLLLTACTNDAEQQESKAEMTIYTSIYPIEYFTQRIGMDKVYVKSVYPPGVDAHTYEPTAKTMTNIAKSDAFIYLGAGLEGFAESAADALENEDVQLVELGKEESLFSEVDEDHHEGHDHGSESDKDPHIWIDPIRAKEMATYIKETLISLKPKYKDEFEQNYQALVADLDELHSDYEQVTNTANQKEIFVSHAAYGYWEQRYGLEQVSVNGISPNSAPSQRELERLIGEAKTKDMNYMIFEQNVSNKVASIIQKEVGAKPVTIHNLSVRTEENIENKEDYITIMRQNLDVLKKVLK